MTARKGRTQRCDREQARTRLDNAAKSLEVAELAAVSAEHGIPFHTDAVQAAAQVPVHFAASGADAAHRIRPQIKPAPRGSGPCARPGGRRRAHVERPRSRT